MLLINLLFIEADDLLSPVEMSFLFDVFVHGSLLFTLCIGLCTWTVFISSLCLLCAVFLANFQTLIVPTSMSDGIYQRSISCGLGFVTISRLGCYIKGASLNTLLKLT
eukprot:Blabericola_migrator_1__9775@NODE_5360_length_794_cov_133_041265_g3445_i0_p2_GENE_NODE_5360_length_794_cov_133_041265_g3445_i0NODE_5360_length_794_cov_133_041265_g3445_i0_p2_ORF_typecomplete_len108_score10_16DUF1700/PF08006_11/5_8_NODE_5360_length_794_cov_133_041265_g3445_i0392715